MDWLDFDNVGTGLIAIFTGLTAWVTWKLYEDQKAQRLPAVFLRCDMFDNGCRLRITVRNRADHPMRVIGMEVVNSGQIGLVKYRGSASGTRGTQRINEVYGEGPAQRSVETDMTLTSVNRNSDSGYREYVLFASRPPAQIEMKIFCDPSDGSGAQQIIRRSYRFSVSERRTITKFSLPND